MLGLFFLGGIFMKIILGERCSGKTTNLIAASAVTGATIITATNNGKKGIICHAQNMGLTIPNPITLREFAGMSSHGRQEKFMKKGIIVDDIELMLSSLFYGLPIERVSLTTNGINEVEFFSSLLKKEE
jgi:hypothetical protein